MIQLAILGGVRLTGGDAERLTALLAQPKRVVLLAYLTLGLDPSSALAEAHARASDIEERIRRARPDIADVIVHTEP